MIVWSSQIHHSMGPGESEHVRALTFAVGGRSHSVSGAGGFDLY
jgi:hypothetical protein